MRYQQKQKVELEQKRSEIIGGGRGLAAIDANENGKMLPALIGNGKVSTWFVLVGRMVNKPTSILEKVLIRLKHVHVKRTWSWTNISPSWQHSYSEDDRQDWIGQSYDIIYSSPIYVIEIEFRSDKCLWNGDNVWLASIKVIHCNQSAKVAQSILPDKKWQR